LRTDSQSILKFDGESIEEVIVVDDASSEPQPRFDDSRVHIIRNERNVGYIACVNIGIGTTKSPFVLLLDSDAYLLAPLAEACEKEFTANTDLGIIGFRLLDGAGRPTGASSPFPTVTGLILGQRLGGFIEGKTSEHRALHSCTIALRKAAFEDIGGFDERFDFLDGDIDFAMRLQVAGWQAKIREDIPVFHVGGGSPQATSKRVLRFHRNRLALLRKHGRLTRPWLVKSLLLIRHGIEVSILLVALVFRRQDERIKDKFSGRVRLIRTVLNDYE
jgi:GT2 family glycosyltransferase